MTVNLSRILSRLPLRFNGVRDTIIFVASATAHNCDVTASSPALSLEVLGHAAQLLTSIPSTMTPEAYFATIGPQILTLLDEDGTDMQRAAAYITGIGILGKRAFGSSEGSGWKTFAEPIIQTFMPGIQHDSQLDLKIEPLSPPPLVSSDSLRSALHRLGSLTLIHPNPGLVKRFMSILLLPIWGVLCLTDDVSELTGWSTHAFRLLCTYIKVSEGLECVTIIADHLRWNGNKTWIYEVDNKSGVKIRGRSSDSSEKMDIIALAENIDARVKQFNRLVTETMNHSDIGKIFAYATRKWLSNYQSNSIRRMQGLNYDDTTTPLSMLVFTKITQSMLEQFQDIIASHPESIIELVKQLLEDFVTKYSQSDMPQTKKQPSISSLRSIVSENEIISEDQTEIVSIAISILLALLSSSEFAVGPPIAGILLSIQTTLSALIVFRHSLPAPIILSAYNVSSLIIAKTAVSAPTSLKASKSCHSKSIDLARQTHATALEDINSSLPPIRAEGLSLLSSLITTSSPIIDIPFTITLLLSLLDENEEYLFLAAIKALGLLAQRHSHTVLDMLIEQYIDQNERASLDTRLRIGEALRAVIEGLGKALVEKPAKKVAEAMIATAGRRSRRPQGADARKRQFENEERKRQEAEKAWGGEVPQIDDTDDGNIEEDQVTSRLAKVIEGWEGPPTSGLEDVRIRTSALSILGIAIETNIAGIGSSLVSTAIDLSISILKIEISDEKAILRRAAVLLILSLIRALDKADEEERALGFGLQGNGLDEVIKVLDYVRVVDGDEIVRGHIGEVVKSLEVWRKKSLLGAAGTVGKLDGEMGLEGGLRGLNFNPDAGAQTMARIEEVE